MLKSCDSEPGLILVDMHIDDLMQMQMYPRYCTSRMNLVNLAGTPCLVFVTDHFNDFESSQTMRVTSFEENASEAYFLEQSTVPFPWNLYLTDMAWEGRRLEISDTVFGPHCTRDWVAHSWFRSNLEEQCNCEGHNCTGIHLTIAHPAAAATTVMSLGIVLIVVVPLTPTHSKIDIYIWYRGIDLFEPLRY